MVIPAQAQKKGDRSCSESFRPDKQLAEFFCKIGLVTSLMGATRTYCVYPVACIALWLEPAIRHEQIHFFWNESGIPIGYVTWAWLAPDTERRLTLDPEVLLHISEWNEGSSLWILDFVLTTGNLRPRLREVAALFGETDQAHSARRNDDGTVRKVITWRQRTSKSAFQPRS